MLFVPERLVSTCQRAPDRAAWLEQLPLRVRRLQKEWSLTLEDAFDGVEVSCAWVAPAVREDVTRALLKLGMPHMESAHEAHGLRFWDGDPTVRLLESDADLDAMLLERCEPGTPLRERPEPEQDAVIAGLLRRLWRNPATPHPFRPLSEMTATWAEETMAAAPRRTDLGLVQAGLRLMEELSRPSPDDVLLATDLHAGNVLQAQRRPYLMIDPKPFIGDPAYDATQHLFNCRERVLTAPDATIRGFADLLGVDAERVRLWMFARAAAEPRDIWDDDSINLAKVLE